MNRSLPSTCLAAFFLLNVSSTSRAGVELGGSVGTENYIGLDDGDLFNFRNANWLKLKISADPNEKVDVFADLELRNTNFSNVQNLSELWDRQTVEPLSWRINMAVMNLYGFLLNNDLFMLDLNVGKQILAWGEGDGFNPTNLLDPYNLENPHDFDQRLGNVSLRATLYVGDEWFALEGVVVPRFLPSVLPVDLLLGGDLLNNPLMPRIDPALFTDIEGVDVRFASVDPDRLKTIQPTANLSNVQAGLRLRWTMFDFDWSLSYAHGRHVIPAPKKAMTSLRFENPGVGECPQGDKSCAVVVVEQVELIYPKVDVLGANVRAEIGDVGVWAEVALLFPQSVMTQISFPSQIPIPGLANPLELTSIEKTPFTKWVAGAEYTLPGGLYLNLQWLHGFFLELSGQRLHDYLIAVLRKSFMSERLRLEVTLGGELDSTLDRYANGAVVKTTLAYHPYDNTQVVLGAAIARGDEGTTFGLFKRLDQVFLSFKVDF